MLKAVQGCPTVCRIYCASANPTGGLRHPQVGRQQVRERRYGLILPLGCPRLWHVRCSAVAHLLCGFTRLYIAAMPVCPTAVVIGKDGGERRGILGEFVSCERRRFFGEAAPGTAGRSIAWQGALTLWLSMADPQHGMWGSSLTGHGAACSLHDSVCSTRPARWLLHAALHCTSCRRAGWLLPAGSGERGW